MLTIHAADLLLPLGGRDLVPGGAVTVDGGRVAAFGELGAVVAEAPGARVRRWPGVLMPGLVNRLGPELLEAAYHPDPRESDALGELPLTGRALADHGLAELPDARWGESARRGLQRMLRHGTTAVAGPFFRPSVRTAVARSGLVVVARSGPPSGTTAPGGTGGLDPLAGIGPDEVPAAACGPLAVGSRADLAVFDVSASGSEAYAVLAARGAGACVATVLAGRLAFRRA